MRPELDALRTLNSRKNTENLRLLIDEQRSIIDRMNHYDTIQKGVVAEIGQSIKAIGDAKGHFLKSRAFESNMAYAFHEDIDRISNCLDEVKLALYMQTGSTDQAYLKDEVMLYDEIDMTISRIIFSATIFMDELSQQPMANPIALRAIAGALNVALKPRVFGSIPDGPCIIAPSEQATPLNSIILYNAIGRKGRFAVGAQAFRYPVSKHILLEAGWMPVRGHDFNAIESETFERMLTNLKFGERIAIFPETNGKVEKAVKLAHMAQRRLLIDVPVIPVGLRFRPHLGTARVAFGVPVTLKGMSGLDHISRVRRLSQYSNHVFDDANRLSRD
jgi:hypothetical protein